MNRIQPKIGKKRSPQNMRVEIADAARTSRAREGGAGGMLSAPLSTSSVILRSEATKDLPAWVDPSLRSG
jgi:hypothetical protein